MMLVGGVFCHLSSVDILELYHPQCPKFCHAQMLSKLNIFIYRKVIRHHQVSLESSYCTLIYPQIVVFSLHHEQNEVIF